MSVAKFTSLYARKWRLSHLPRSRRSLASISSFTSFQHHSHFLFLLYCRWISQTSNSTASTTFHHFVSSFGIMSACGYNDPEMLKAAIELAKSFSKAKGNGKNRAGGGGQGGRKEHLESPQPRQQSRYGQIAAPPRQVFTPSAPSLRPMAPPPSRRNYGASGDFATRRAASRPVIGSLGREFLVSSGVKAEPERPSKLAPYSAIIDCRRYEIIETLTYL
jgi:hypothetical protein